MMVPASKAKQYGLQPGHAKFKEELGGGFVAQIEVFHKLHCLVWMKLRTTVSIKLVLQAIGLASENFLLELRALHEGGKGRVWRRRKNAYSSCRYVTSTVIGTSVLGFYLVRHVVGNNI